MWRRGKDLSCGTKTSQLPRRLSPENRGCARKARFGARGWDAKRRVVAVSQPFDDHELRPCDALAQGLQRFVVRVVVERLAEAMSGKRSRAMRVGCQSPSRTTNGPPRAKYSPPYLRTMAGTLALYPC